MPPLSEDLPPTSLIEDLPAPSGMGLTAAAVPDLPPGTLAVLASEGRDPSAPGAVAFTLIQSDRPATKTYQPDTTGRPIKAADPSLSEGTAFRASLSGAAPLAELARVLDNMPGDVVLMCGALADTRDVAPLTTKARLASRPGAIARTKDCVIYLAGRPGLGMIDHDAKDLPDELRERLEAAGGLDAVLASICPEFGRAGVLSRPSVSTGIRAVGSDHEVPGGGRHIYFVARNGEDIPAFIARLHRHLVLNGWGWVLISKDGRCHMRSLIDALVSGNPYWLTFEANAVLGAGLEYAPGARSCVVERDGVLFDTMALADLTPAEAAKLANFQAALLAQAEPAASLVRDKVLAERTDKLVAGGMERDKARARVAQAFGRQRLDTSETVMLDDGRNPTVADILRDPEAFDGGTGADPLEPDYGGGRNKAIWYTGGRPVRCFSQAHGGQLFVAGWTAADIAEAWSARRDPAEIHGMYPLSLFDNPDADKATLAAADVPTWPGLDFCLDDLPKLPGMVAREEWHELAILKGQLRGAFTDRLAVAVACSELDGASIAAGLAGAEAVLSGAGAIPTGWEDRITRGKGGQVQPTLSNVLAGLGQGCGLNRHLRLDRAIQRRVLADVPPGSAVWDALALGRVMPLYMDPLTSLPVFAWSDTLLTAALLHLEHSGAGLTNRGHAEAAVEKIAEDNAYSSVARYLRALVWDGTPRLDGWLVRHAAAEATSFNQAAPSRWMIGAVARALRPEERGGPVQMDTALVLAGPQGAGKSQFFRALCPVPLCHSESSLGDLSSKDALVQLAAHWIVDLAEGSSVKANEVESFKQYLTATTDNYRPPYGRNTVSVPRRVVFAMTINPNGAGFLRDSTGNHRLWVVEVEAIDIVQLRRDRDQLWAEAVARYDAGKHWWFVKSDPQDAILEAEGAAAAEGHRIQTNIEVWLRRYVEEAPVLNEPGGTSWTPRVMPLTVMGTTTDVLREIGQNKASGNAFSEADFARALTSMGWVRERVTLRKAPVERGRTIWVDATGAAALRKDKRTASPGGYFQSWLEERAREGSVGLRSGAGINAEWYKAAKLVLPGAAAKASPAAGFV